MSEIKFSPNDAVLRKLLVADFMAIGAGETEAAEIVDLALHAAASAIETLVAVAERTPSYNTKLAVLGAAASLMKAKCNDIHHRIRDQAARTGGAVREDSITVSVQ